VFPCDGAKDRGSAKVCEGSKKRKDENIIDRNQIKKFNTYKTKG
jgi:hypothetical protein